MLADISWYVAQIVLLLLAADLLGGLFHWAEDSYGTQDTPIWGPLFVAPNVRHHAEPAAMMRKHWLPNNAPLFGVAAMIVLGSWAFNALTWQVVVFAVLSGLNQQAHRFEHAPRLRLPRIVQLLQSAHLLQDARHHWRHHVAPHRTHFCVLTPWLNPVLDRISFWRRLEQLLLPVLGPVRQDA